MTLMSKVLDYRQQVAALHQWFGTDLGQMVLTQEALTLQAFTQQLFGYYLFELGLLCSHPDYMTNSPIRSFVRGGPCHADGVDLQTLPEQLPLAGDSLDAVVLPHTLDFVVDPRQVLREVERVLIPEGRVLITGFNPYSLWGLWRLIPGSSRRLPWKGHFIPYARLQDWLSLLGFEVEQVKTLLFRPPWKKVFLKHRFPRLDRAGQRFMPWSAGVYVIVAVKRVSTLTPVRPRWRLERKLGKVVVQPLANCSRGDLKE